MATTKAIFESLAKFDKWPPEVQTRYLKRALRDIKTLRDDVTSGNIRKQFYTEDNLIILIHVHDTFVRREDLTTLEIIDFLKEHWENRVSEEDEYSPDVSDDLCKVSEESPTNKSSTNVHIRIEEDSDGNSYDSTFGSVLGERVTSVTLEDPYIGRYYQLFNFLRLCELLVKKCPKLAKIFLLTKKYNNGREQEDGLQELKQSLSKKKIVLEWEFSTTLHDRQLKLDSGCIIRLGRGLDMFKAPVGKMVLGSLDMDLRKCRETTVDIFYCK